MTVCARVYHLGRDKRPVKSLVVGRPILLALEDIDGGPSFLEKALRFLEKFGKWCHQIMIGLFSKLLYTCGAFPLSRVLFCSFEVKPFLFVLIKTDSH